MIGPFEINRPAFGDALELARKLPDESIHCIVTSPPYWGLRDYGMDGQLGLEKTPAEYVEKLIKIFRELIRVLREDGTCWLNLGDCYYTGKGACYNPGSGPLSRVNYGKRLKAANAYPAQRKQPNRMLTPSRAREFGLKPKDLVGIPWRVAFALQEDGWILRSDVIWSKPNPLPESVRDRPMKSHEYLFLLTRTRDYHFDIDVIREPQETKEERHNGLSGCREGHPTKRGFRRRQLNPKGANRRSVWTIPVQPYPGNHFSTFPPDLIKPCILAGCPEGGIVLDPFLGSGTTGMVCQELGRRWLGFEINPEYEPLIEKRIQQQGLFGRPK